MSIETGKLNAFVESESTVQRFKDSGDTTIPIFKRGGKK